MRFIHHPKFQDPSLGIPAFLDRRQFANIGGEQFIVLPDFDPAKLYDPRGPRTWAPIRATHEIKRKAEAPAAQLYCANKNWMVQVVRKGKNPQNLNLYDNWDQFIEKHSFTDYPIERTFQSDGITYIVVKNDLVRNTIVNNAMAGGVKLNTRPDLMEQNGVKRPKTGTITAAAWAKFDDMREKGEAFKGVFDALLAGGMNGSTIRTQFSHWRKFNGIPK